MFRIFGKLVESSSKAIRRTYRPAVDALEARAVPAVDAFIWFEAPNPEVPEVRDTNVEQQPVQQTFEIKDFSFGVENPTTIGSATGGAGAGKIKFNEFTIKKTTDSASPAVCPSDPSLPQATLDAVFSGPGDERVESGPGDEGPEESITFVFGKLGAQSSGPGDEGPEESISFVYGKL